MSAESLLAHYEQVADAPDAIKRLRSFILDLAVHGKLSPRATQWQTVGIEECLEPLADGRLIHQGWSPQCESHSSRSEEVWGVLKTTAIQDGFYLEEHNKELPAKLGPKEILEVRAGDVLITCAGPRARCGVACLVRETRKRLLISGKMYRFRANKRIASPSYLTLWLRATEAQAAIDTLKTGSSESGLNLTQDRFRTLRVRLGSVAEQHHIVAKVDELMGLCDRLEAARAAREAVRDQLAATSFARFNTSETAAPRAAASASNSPPSALFRTAAPAAIKLPTPEVVNCFADHARFVLDILPALTARPDQIKALRHTILNLAVRGKLVSPDAQDEPASELLTRIAKEKVHRRHGTVSIRPEDEPFALPATWKWTALDQLIVSGPQNGISPKPTMRDGAPRAITLTATTSGTFNPIHFKHVEADIPADSDFWLEDGDLLFQRGNTREYVGMAAVYRGPPNAFLFPDLIMKVRLSEHVCIEFAHLASISPPARDFLSGNASGAQATMPKINQATLVSLPIPLPPLAEQRRIVAKVDALMALCDRLETSLTATAAGRHRLLDALFAEALEPNVNPSKPAIGSIGTDLAAQTPVNYEERSAFVLAFAFDRHQSANRDRTFGHVKAQKILHLVEAETNLDLGRTPIKDAAGPNDFPHLLATEEWARSNRHFVFEKIGNGYTFRPLAKFGELKAKELMDSQVRMRMAQVVDLFVPMDTQASEVFATVYAAWNNLLIEGKHVTDENIVRAAREDWHPTKANIPRYLFFKALIQLKGTAFIPRGKGKFVGATPSKNLFE